MEQYKSQNAVIEKDLPTLREIVGSTWKKEEELKQFKSEMAALERKIQLVLAPPKSEAGQEENGQRELQSETVKLDTSDNFIRNHMLVVRPGISEESKMQSRGMKI